MMANMAAVPAAEMSATATEEQTETGPIAIVRIVVVIIAVAIVPIPVTGLITSVPPAAPVGCFLHARDARNGLEVVGNASKRRGLNGQIKSGKRQSDKCTEVESPESHDESPCER
jgi:hypothetical protein